jgi:hypothetical protein
VDSLSDDEPFGVSFVKVPPTALPNFHLAFKTAPLYKAPIGLGRLSREISVSTFAPVSPPHDTACTACGDESIF